MNIEILAVQAFVIMVLLFLSYIILLSIDENREYRDKMNQIHYDRYVKSLDWWSVEIIRDDPYLTKEQKAYLLRRKQ